MAEFNSIAECIADLRRDEGCYPSTNIQNLKYTALIEAMGCKGDSPARKAECLTILIKHFFESESEKGELLLVSLNLLGDEYIHIKSSQRRCWKYKGIDNAENLTDKMLRADDALRSHTDKLRYEEGKIIKSFSNWLAEASISDKISKILDAKSRETSVNKENLNTTTKIGDFSWEYSRVWWPTLSEKTENGFSVDDDGEILLIRNDYYEIAEARIELPLESNSKYTFSVEAKVIDFEAHPENKNTYPGWVGGAVPEYHSAQDSALIMYTPKMHNLPEWKTLTWVVHTNKTKYYALRLRNGTSNHANKGTAYFRNLKWEKMT